MSDENKADKLPDDILWHQSGVNAKGEPFVQLLRGTDIVGQMSPAEARDHGAAMFMAAEAAEQDAFLWSFAREEMGMPVEQAGSILVAFRAFRERTTDKRGGPTRGRQWIMPK